MVGEHPSEDSAPALLRAELDRALAARAKATAVEAALTAVRDGAVDVPTLYLRVLTPLLVETGDAWQRGTTRIWEEHFASTAVRTIIESLYLDVQRIALSAEPNGRVALLACPREEVHELGLRMLADRLTLAGWQAHFLGADTPTEEIVAAARALGADIVALSAATHYNRVLLCRVIEELTESLPGVRIGVGGPSFEHGGCDERYRLTDSDLGLPTAEER